MELFNDQTLANNEINTHMKLAVDILKEVKLVSEEEILGYDLPEDMPQELKSVLDDDEILKNISFV